MPELLLTLIIGLILLTTLILSFKHFPRENYQILLTMPREKQGDKWKATNFTYYGAILGGATIFACGLLLLLLARLGLPLHVSAIILALIYSVAIPAAKIMVWLVEHHRHGFTVGGAAFVGTLLSPVIAGIVLSCYGYSLTYLSPILAALAIVFLIGEGLGRLGCISFGCCYGKPIEECGPLGRMIFSKFYFIFKGPLKKACYESKYSGVKVIPIQGITSSIYCASGLLGFYLFLEGYYYAALCCSVIIHQMWRFYSEFMRDDGRGDLLKGLTRYQWMALTNIAYCVLLGWLLPHENLTTKSLTEVWEMLYSPSVVIGLQLAGLLVFYYTGRSEVTGSDIEFHLRTDGCQKS